MFPDAITNKSILNIARLKQQFGTSDDELHAAIQNGQLPLIIDVAGIFVAPVKRQVNGQYLTLGDLRHIDSGFLFVPRNYYRKLERSERVEMGLASTKHDGEPDYLIWLRGSDNKPRLALDELYTLEDAAKQLFNKDSPTHRRYAEGVDAAKRMLREKHKAGQLRNDDDVKKCKQLKHVIRYLRDNPGDFPEVAKTKPVDLH